MSHQLSIFLILLLTSSGLTWKTSYLSRRVGVNLKHPKTDKPIPKSVTTDWFTQKLDHFQPTDQGTWQQRYYTNDQYVDSEKSGPIFLYIEGEAGLSPFWMTNGSWIRYAETYGARLFALEHRFYGESHPTEDLSTENLQYLTSQQALADVATFIEGMNEKFNFSKDVKWIAFGGSYAGSLTAWLRLKYPHLVHGAVSSSGPIRAKVDLFDYFRVVQESLATHSDECVTEIQRAVSQMAVLQQDAEGQEQLNTLFNLCSPIQDSLDNPDDISSLYRMIAIDFAGVVQHNPNKVVQNEADLSINLLCDVLVDEGQGSPIERFAKAHKVIMDQYAEPCLFYQYDALLEYYKMTNWDNFSADAVGIRQWTYQTCTELGFFQTSSYKPQIFGDDFPVEYYIKQCQDIFGEAFTAEFLDGAVNHTNIMYGGLDIEVTNTVFIYGSIDPWHSAGILETVSEESPVIYIEGTSHGADLADPTPDDPPQLTEARNTVEELIGSWLNQK